MGTCFSSSKESPEHQQSVEIDRRIKEDKQKQKKEYKILLLGSGESGKSTILKQMKIINKNGYTDEELLHWRIIVYRNIIDSAKILDEVIDRFNENYPCDPATQSSRELIRACEVPGDPHLRLAPHVAEAVKKMWRDPAVKRLVKEKQDEFYLMDSARYFFDEIERISHDNYIPSVQDVLRARQKSTGITELDFEASEIKIRMFDVGGQRSERRKWIHCFDSVTSVIFCVALSEYDQVLLEESSQNRMQESLVLFESIINSRWFKQASIMLFLNKVDIFREKIPRVPLERYFPEYEGGDDPKKAAKYILWRFMQTNRNNLNIYPHLTQATDTTNIRIVFAAVKDTLLQNALRDSGML